MKTAAIITAAGAGIRMGGDQAKQFMELEGWPILAVTLERFDLCPDIDGIVLVVPPGKVDYCRREIVEKYELAKVKKVVPEGRSVRIPSDWGLKRLKVTIPLS